PHPPPTLSPLSLHDALPIYSSVRAPLKSPLTSSSLIVSIPSTRSSVASPPKDCTSCTSQWNSSVVSGFSGRIHAEPRRLTAPIRLSLRHTPTRWRVGVRGRLTSRISQRIPLAGHRNRCYCGSQALHSRATVGEAAPRRPRGRTS